MYNLTESIPSQISSVCSYPVLSTYLILISIFIDVKTDTRLCIVLKSLSINLNCYLHYLKCGGYYTVKIITNLLLSLNSRIQYLSRNLEEISIQDINPQTLCMVTNIFIFNAM